MSAFQTLAQLRAEWLQPDVITYSASISACEKGGQWRSALELLSKLGLPRLLLGLPRQLLGLV